MPSSLCHLPIYKAEVHKSRRQDAVTTTCCTVAHNICGSSVWNLLHVTFLTPRILECLIGFWKVCAPLV